MRSCSEPDLAVSGIGVAAAIGQGKSEFVAALLAGRHGFARMRRAGRAMHSDDGDAPAFLGAEIESLKLPESLAPRLARGASLTAQAAVATVSEAWQEARLAGVDPERIGLVIGGSNLQQRELVQTYGAYAGRARYVRPSYASSFLDSDLCGLCSELFGIKGPAYTVGAASASGQVAVIHAAQAVASEQVDVCIAVGALMDLSHWECQALRSAGAMGSDRYADSPARACRPFDRSRDGFIYGECCAALVIERAHRAASRGVRPYAQIAGWSIVNDGSRGTSPSYEGELAAIRKALDRSGFDPGDIDYVKPHGTGSVIGDDTELRAIRAAGLSHARLNATKSLTGHGLTAAGAVELAAALLQMQTLQLHPTRNLEHPIDPQLNWVRDEPVRHRVRRCLSLSMGFGGINTAVCLRSLHDS